MQVETPSTTLHKSKHIGMDDLERESMHSLPEEIACQHFPTSDYRQEYSRRTSHKQNEIAESPSIAYYELSNRHKSTMSASGDKAEESQCEFDQFFIVPGIQGALSTAEFDKINTIQTDRENYVSGDMQPISCDHPRNDMTEDITSQGNANAGDWRLLQQQRIQGLEAAINEKERKFCRDRRSFHEEKNNYTKKLHQLQVELSKEQVERRAIERDNGVYLEKNQLLEDKIASLNNEMTICMGNLRQGEEEKHNLHKRISELEKQVDMLHEARRKAESSQEENARLRCDMDQYKLSIDELTRELNAQKSEREELAKQHATILVTNQSIQQDLLDEKKLNAELSQKIGELNQSSDEWKASVQAEQARQEKKITLLIRGMRAIEDEWKQRYQKLDAYHKQREKSSTQSSQSKETELTSAVNSLNDQLRKCRQEMNQANDEIEDKDDQIARVTGELETQRRCGQEEQRQMAAEMAARELTITQLRAQLERTELRVSAVAEATAMPASQQQNSKPESVWQQAYARLKQLTRRLIEENQRLKQQQRCLNRSTCDEKRERPDELGGAAPRLAEENDCLRELLAQARRRQRRTARKSEVSGVTAEYTNMLRRLRHVTLSCSKLSELIEERDKTISRLDGELRRHRATANSQRFLQQHSGKLQRLLHADKPLSASSPVVTSSSATREDGDHAGHHEESPYVQALKYKLQLAASYITQQAEQYKQLCDQLERTKHLLAAQEHHQRRSQLIGEARQHLPQWRSLGELNELCDSSSFPWHNSISHGLGMSFSTDDDEDTSRSLTDLDLNHKPTLTKTTTCSVEEDWNGSDPRDKTQPRSKETALPKTVYHRNDEIIAHKARIETKENTQMTGKRRSNVAKLDDVTGRHSQRGFFS